MEVHGQQQPFATKLKMKYEEESKSNLNIFLLTEYVQIGLKTLRHFST
jgi:hypothetical protein